MPDDIAICRQCRYSAATEHFPAAVSLYHDLRCPKCGTTDIDTSAADVGDYGDDNTINLRAGEDLENVDRDELIARLRRIEAAPAGSILHDKIREMLRAHARIRDTLSKTGD